MKKNNNIGLTIFLTVTAIVFLFPIFIVLMNSFKGQFYIADMPFKMPTAKTFTGFENYVRGIEKTDFVSACGYSFFITVLSVGLIVFFPSMTAWYIVRVKNGFSKLLYHMFVLSMVIPFQIIMYTVVKVSNVLYLDNPVGITLIYLGLGSGLSVFMYSGFVKSVPLEVEEAAMVDGCTPRTTFFRIIFPILRPITVTVAILNTMWIWNDYLLPLLLIGSDYRTIPLAVQYLKGGYGSIDMGAMMALLVLAVVPVVVFYLFGQKYIIEGVVAGAVKG